MNQCNIADVIAEILIWLLMALDGLNKAAIALQWKTPVCPHWTSHGNAISNVQKCMDGQWACKEPVWVIVIIKSWKNSIWLW